MHDAGHEDDENDASAYHQHHHHPPSSLHRAALHGAAINHPILPSGASTHQPVQPQADLQDKVADLEQNVRHLTSIMENEIGAIKFRGLLYTLQEQDRLKDSLLASQQKSSPLATNYAVQPRQSTKPKAADYAVQPHRSPKPQAAGYAVQPHQSPKPQAASYASQSNQPFEQYDPDSLFVDGLCLKRRASPHLQDQRHTKSARNNSHVSSKTVSPSALGDSILSKRASKASSINEAPAAPLQDMSSSPSPPPSPAPIPAKAQKPLRPWVRRETTSGCITNRHPDFNFEGALPPKKKRDCPTVPRVDSAQSNVHDSSNKANSKKPAAPHTPLDGDAKSSHSHTSRNARSSTPLSQSQWSKAVLPKGRNMQSTTSSIKTATIPKKSAPPIVREAPWV
jgi:hypothetical protein